MFCTILSWTYINGTNKVEWPNISDQILLDGVGLQWSSKMYWRPMSHRVVWLRYWEVSMDTIRNKDHFNDQLWSGSDHKKNPFLPDGLSTNSHTEDAGKELFGQ